MRALFAALVGMTGLLLAGCSTPVRLAGPPVLPAGTATPASDIVQAGYFAAGGKYEDLAPPRKLGAELSAGAGNAHAVGLPDLIGLSLQRNPRLGQVGWAVEAARGRAIQAGMYPNPTVNVTGNEISDRTGPGGIWTAYTSQEVVTANKLGLSQAAALKEVDQATLNLIAERYRVFTEVRAAFFEAVAIQRRAEILGDLVTLAERSVTNAENLRKAKEVAELDVVQLEVDQERYRAELEATRRALPAASRRLAASVGLQDMPISRLLGDLDVPLPDYDLDRVRLYVLGIHPELRSAQVGVERARLVLRRAQAEPIPNVTVGAGYTYQGQNRSNDWDVGVSVPVPVWNTNQGNIRAAKAQAEDVRWFKDKFTGTSMDRPGLDKLLADARAGKISKVVVWRLDRLGRTARGLLALLDELQALGVGFVSLREGIDLSTPAGRLMLVVLAGVSQYETEVRKERRNRSPDFRAEKCEKHVDFHRLIL